MDPFLPPRPAETLLPLKIVNKSSGAPARSHPAHRPPPRRAAPAAFSGAPEYSQAAELGAATRSTPIFAPVLLLDEARSADSPSVARSLRSGNLLACRGKPGTPEEVSLPKAGESRQPGPERGLATAHFRCCAQLRNAADRTRSFISRRYALASSSEMSLMASSTVIPSPFSIRSPPRAGL